MESEEEALFRSYPYAVYFVQSPSNVSHANTNTNLTNLHHQESALSRYSSSRESHDDSSFPQFNPNPNPNHKKKTSHLLLHKLDDDDGLMKNAVDREDEEEEDDDEIDMYKKKKGWIKYLSLSYSNSGWWIFVQLSWRFLVSLIIAMLVFYVTAKPPHPNLSLKVAGIPQFRLGEGVDASGVTTKILSCNFSINLIIDNDSKLFALHIHPPIIKLIFGRLTFAMSQQQMQGREFYAGNDDLTTLRFNIGTKNKAMYGAGRNMQDFLESEKGLPLVIRVSLRSRFNVIWGIFEPKYNYEAQCLVILSDYYDKKHRTQVYNSTCVIHS